jgi:NhaP-type Na+/H+ or K+/H+ antiporter
VVTLAAVFLLPPETPNRQLLQFLAFVVVAGTLLEGLALPWIIRRLKLPPPDVEQERGETQRLMVEAQTAGLDLLEQQELDGVEPGVVDRLRTNARFLAEALENPPEGDGESRPASYNRLRRLMVQAERQAVLDARAEGRYQERAVKTTLAFIDAEETALDMHKPPKPGSNLT